MQPHFPQFGAVTLIGVDGGTDDVDDDVKPSEIHNEDINSSDNTIHKSEQPSEEGPNSRGTLPTSGEDPTETTTTSLPSSNNNKPIEQVGEESDSPHPPAPARMLGRFWKLAALRHPHLCRYLELARCHAASNGVVLMSEHYPNTYWERYCCVPSPSADSKSQVQHDSSILANHPKTKESMASGESGKAPKPSAKVKKAEGGGETPKWTVKSSLWVAEQIASAIEHCHNKGIVIGYLTLDCIVVAEQEADSTTANHSASKRVPPSPLPPAPSNPHFSPAPCPLVKLEQYGLYHLSGMNTDVDEVLAGDLCYMAPERLLAHDVNNMADNKTNLSARRHKQRLPPHAACFKSDIWAFGVALFEIFARRRALDLAGSREAWLGMVGDLLREESTKSSEELKAGTEVKGEEGSLLIPPASMLSRLLPLVEEEGIGDDQPRLAKIWPVLKGCLRPFPSQRPSASELLHKLRQLLCWDGVSSSKAAGGQDGAEVDPAASTVRPLTRCAGLEESIDEMRERVTKKAQAWEWRSGDIPLEELFHLWKLCGSGVERILINKGVIQLRPPICTLPSLVIDDFQLYGNETARHVHVPFTIHRLPSGNLRRRLLTIPGRVFSHSFELEERKKALLMEKEKRKLGPTSMGPSSTTQAVLHFSPLPPANQAQIQHPAENEPTTVTHQSTSEQTLVIRERDIEYQLGRMGLFRRLLSAYPHKLEKLRLEASRDIPPLYRGRVWAALLGCLPPPSDNELFSHYDDEFYCIDTLSEQVSDRQLNVDIPRCHQYDELMTTPEAHSRLRQLLKAWLATHPQYVYWQGLDSLAAPFLVLHFNDLPAAYNCFAAFIDRYLPNFFLKDNAVVMQENLAAFMSLLHRLDPELHTHLVELDFHPELYAIPWFLTCFAHVLPLHKLFHLWDSLMLADASFPLHIGVAILEELRPDLMAAQFNDAILLFSDLPDLSIDSVVANSLRYYTEVAAKTPVIIVEK